MKLTPVILLSATIALTPCYGGVPRNNMLASYTKFATKHKSGEKVDNKLRYYEQLAVQAFKREVDYAYRFAKFTDAMNEMAKDPSLIGMYAGLYGMDPEEHLLEKYQIMKTVCSDCSALIGYKDGGGCGGISHGYCDPHFEAFIKALDIEPLEIDRKEPEVRA